MLMQGEALVASPFTPFAVPVKIHLYEEYLKEFDNKTENSGVKADAGFF